MFKLSRCLLSLLLVFIMASTFFTGVAAAETIPAAPINLKSDVISGNQVNLTWTYSSSDKVGFEIEREQGGRKVAFDLGTGLTGTDTGIVSFADTGLTPDTTYTYRVRAYNSAGFSNFSTPVTVTTTASPEAPSRLEVNLVADTRANLTWVDNAKNELGFKIERKTNQGDFVQIGTVKANSTYFLDTGLSVGNVYIYRVQSYNAAGGSPFSNEATISTGKPNAPDNLVLTTVSTSCIDLSWRDNSNNETGFRIERKTEKGNYTQIATVGANVTSYSCTGLANNTWYTFRVSAYNAAGDSYSREEKATTGPVPEAPSNLVAKTVSASCIDLTWRDNSNNETGFIIERKTEDGDYSQVATVKANVTSFSNKGLKNDTEYTYRVRAYNSFASSPYSREASAVTGTPPAAPANLKVEVLSQNRIRLTWDDRANNERGFRIECKRGSRDFRQVATVSANATSFTDTDLEPGVEYVYRVQAYNVVGDSAYSNEAKATIAPKTPTNLVATPHSATRIVLKWTNPSSDVSGFRIERKRETGSFTQIDTVSANSTTYTDDGVSPGTRYTYRVRSYNSYGNSPYSNEAVATTPQQTQTRIKLRIGQTSYQVDDRNRSMDTRPIIIEGRTLLPVRFVTEALGAEVKWDEKERKVTVILNNMSIELWINSNLALVNGVRTYIDPDNPKVFPTIVSPGRTMVPLRFISENLNCKVDWKEQTQEVTVIYPAP